MKGLEKARVTVPRTLFLAVLIPTSLGLLSSFQPLLRAENGSGPIFEEVAAETGLVFEHLNGATGKFFLPEIMGSGTALFDYDSDGDLDVYLLQSTVLDQNKTPIQVRLPPKPGWKPGHRLFRNELVPEGRLRFVDLTEQAGVGHVGCGMGAAVADYDNDGDLDLYVTNFGPNVLYRNNGDGTFADVTDLSGAGDPRWSTSAAFLDYDRDGYLDLMVANYLDFTVEGNRICHGLSIRDYCFPTVYRPQPDRLLQNRGNGKFADVTESAGLGTNFGAGLGVVSADFNDDGWIDIYVANDATPNQLWMNNANATFRDMGLLSGTAYNRDGKVEGSMGVTSADFDKDGDEDLFLTNLLEETHTLYLNNGQASFHDATGQFGLAHVTTFTGFGTEWFDYDNDGNLDLFVANGAVHMIALPQENHYAYDQKNQLFRNQGDGKYEETTLEAGTALQLSEVSRGASFGDIDNDGDVDILVTNNNGPARLLLNKIGARLHWLQVELRGVHGNRHGIGARVGVFRDGKPTLWRRAHTDGSYLSASDGRVHFGLGKDPVVKAVVVRWPSGETEKWNEGLQADSLLALRQGSGHPVARTVDNPD